MKWMFWWFSFLRPAFGGGGGDGGARAAAEADERKKARARSSLNALFGIAPDAGALAAEREPVVAQPTIMPGQNTTGAAPGVGPRAYDPRQPSPAVSLAHQPAPAPAPVAAAPVADPRIADAEANRLAREADYQKIFDDVLSLNTNRVKDQHDITARKNKFQIFRQGLGAGSVDIDQSALLKKANDEALLDAGNRASTARTGARQTDEGARLALLQQISGGLDAGSATSSAVRGMDLARENAYDTAKGNLIEGAFDNAGLLYQDNQKAGAIARGRELYRKMSGATTPGGNAYGGTLS